RPPCACLVISHALSFSFLATPATAIDTLSLHDALPISRTSDVSGGMIVPRSAPPVNLARECHIARPLKARTQIAARVVATGDTEDRKSTRLNSSHEWISYAVFCLKKKTTDEILTTL